jgi:phosphoribosylglycinamide formyltransferase 1
VLPRLAILISGGGSNMLAIASACKSGQIRATVAAVIADTATAGGLQKAHDLGLNTQVVHYAGFRKPDGKIDRPAFEMALCNAIDATHADYIILAGFMKVLSASSVAHYTGRMLNIHPSLLPRYKGLDTHARVLAAGDTEHGASVHFVTPELDAGPVVLQGVVPVLPTDDLTRLSARVHAREHIIYPAVIEWLVNGRLRWNAGQPLLDDVALIAPVRWT